MMTNKQRAYSNIQRAIGIIEGVSYGMERAATSEALCDAVEILDEALDELMKEDKPDEG